MQVIDRNKALAITPVLRLAFRPFFLGGSLLALVVVPLWLIALDGGLGWQPAGGWLAWHRHELLFGFGLAIVGGFLLTAVQTWTGQPGLSGKPLAALVLVWLAGRIAWLADLPLPLLVVLELGFPLLLAWLMGRTLWRARQRRNYPLVALLLLLSGVDAIALAGMLTGNDGWQRQGVFGGLWLVAAMMGLIGGRVIPFFTQRGLGRTEAVKPWPWLDWLLPGVSALVALLYATGPALLPSLGIGVLFTGLALGHGIRLARWQDRRLWRVPLLWSLHLAYAWLVPACLGMGLWHFGVALNPSLAVHCLTVGAMAGLILAMIARVSLGHTGRPLQPPAGMALAFVLVNVAGLARVFLVPWNTHAGLGLAALCWALAFALFVRGYGAMLMRGRVDGQPG